MGLDRCGLRLNNASVAEPRLERFCAQNSARASIPLRIKTKIHSSFSVITSMSYLSTILPFILATPTTLACLLFRVHNRLAPNSLEISFCLKCSSPRQYYDVLLPLLQIFVQVKTSKTWPLYLELQTALTFSIPDVFYHFKFSLFHIIYHQLHDIISLLISFTDHCLYSSIAYKLQKGRYFGLFHSFLCLKHLEKCLAISKCSINICSWMKIYSLCLGCLLELLSPGLCYSLPCLMYL